LQAASDSFLWFEARSIHIEAMRNYKCNTVERADFLVQPVDSDFSRLAAAFNAQNPSLKKITTRLLATGSASCMRGRTLH
jgi:hypothetical protein